MKTYTEDQMKDAFEQSRLTHPMVGFKYDTFEDFIKTIPVSLSEREQPVKDGMEEFLVDGREKTKQEYNAIPENESCSIEYAKFCVWDSVLSKYRSLSPCKEKWISVEERLPEIVERGKYDGFEITQEVLGIQGDQLVIGWFQIYTRKNETWNVKKGQIEFKSVRGNIEPTHWRPLPPPPTGDNKKGEGE